MTCDHYWDNHTWASFMVDPLGLRLLGEIGVDKAMWSSDYPHNESTFGYSEKSIAKVVKAVEAGAARMTVIPAVIGYRRRIGHPRGTVRAALTCGNWVELRGFEPLTYSMRTSRATNCAIAPDR